ncbi:MAG TPA: SWIM zinc finger family protein [Candidatus Nanopusillus sp.]|nr:SWIM zinc finger family protein [Candidatus Nanopusillus sp.]
MMFDLVQRVKYIKETPKYVLVEFKPGTSRHGYILTIVYKNSNKFFCSCEYFLFNGTKCKHIILVEKYIKRDLPREYMNLLKKKLIFSLS